MTATQTIGAVATLYGMGGALAVLLQARQISRRASSCDVSARFWAVYVGGYAIWLLYGISTHSAPLIVVNALGLTFGGLTLALILDLRGSLARPSSWNSCNPSPGLAR